MRKIFFLALAIFCVGIVCGQNTRPMVAVMPTVGDVDDDINGAVQDALELGVQKSKQYGLVARGPAFQQALSEMTFQASGAVDDSQMAEFGRAVSADYVCYANIRAVANTFSISYRLINVETLEIPKVNMKSSSNRVDDFITMLDEISDDLFSNIADRRAEEEQRMIVERTSAEERERAARIEWENLKNTDNVDALQNFINQYPGTMAIQSASERLADEKEWNSTMRSYSINAYERYMMGTSAKYLEEAKNWLEMAYLKIAKDAAFTADFQKIDQMYDNCLLLAPYGRTMDDIKTIRCNAYYDEAMKLSKSKNVADLRKANEYLNIAKGTCQARKNIDSQIAKNDKQIRKAR